MGSEHLSKHTDNDLEPCARGFCRWAACGVPDTRGHRCVRARQSGPDRSSDCKRGSRQRVRGPDRRRLQPHHRQRQPAAGDLRLIMAISKTVTDLERIGDEAEKIARMSRQIHERGTRTCIVCDRPPCRGHRIVDAAPGARRLRAPGRGGRGEHHPADVAIDTEFRSILRQLITFMMEDPRTISTALEIVWIAKAIERIGDHAKNIAEDVIYIVKGTDVAPHRGRGRRARGAQLMGTPWNESRSRTVMAARSS